MTQRDVNAFVTEIVELSINDSIGSIKFDLSQEWTIEDFGSLYHDKEAGYLKGYVVISGQEYNFEVGKEDMSQDCVEY